MSLVIPGVETVHPRSTWEPEGFRMAVDFDRPPPAATDADVDTTAIHYPGVGDVPDGDIGEFDYQIGPWLANSQRWYYTSRTGGGYTRTSDGQWFPGYAVGYNWVVDWLGGVWEVRGFDFRSGATYGHNLHTMAIKLMVDLGDKATELAWRSVRALAREAARRSGRTDYRNRPWGHREFYQRTGVGTPTACPGDPVMTQIAQGLGDLDRQEQGTMQSLVKPERAYDSRGNQADWEPTLRTANSGVALGEFSAGERRRIIIGFASEAHVNITVVGSQPGYVSVAGVDQRPNASVVNVDRQGGVNSGSVPVATPEGAVYVWSSHGDCHIIVDVFARA